MKVNWPLVLWLFRPVRGLTAAAAVIATGYTLFAVGPLDYLRDQCAFLFILLHAFLISRLMIRVRSRSFTFLYSEGFTRETLWSHLWLATILSVLAVCVPCAVVTLLPIRASLQDALQNPWYPLLAASEGRFVAWALLTYAILLPVFHYEWIRSAAPFKSLASGNMLALAFLTFGLLLAEPIWRQHSPTRWWIIASFGAVSLVLAIAGRWIHRRIEVCA